MTLPLHERCFLCIDVSPQSRWYPLLPCWCPLCPENTPLSRWYPFLPDDRYSLRPDTTLIRPDYALYILPIPRQSRWYPLHTDDVLLGVNIISCSTLFRYEYI
jgi:hypothetical protein